MGQLSLINGLQYAGYGVELTLLVLLLSPKRIKRFTALCAYVAALFGVDAVGRVWVLHHYGSKSTAYFYSYYLSDLLLALGVFLLLCALFRRACRDHEQVWKFIKPILIWVLLLVIFISAAALRHNFSHLFSTYIFEFNQDLYFVCLLLNTALYLMVQRFKAESDLSLLVCGLGVQLAGPAAGWAFASLKGNGMILMYLSPICSLAMMGIWIYAITRGQEAEHKDAGAPKAKSMRRRPHLSSRDLVSPAMGLRPLAGDGRNKRLVAGPGTLQAGYLQPLRTRV
jgi:hypothetical protein